MRNGYVKCADKVTYKSRGEAYDFLSHAPKFKGCSIYECDVCGMWHITHYKAQAKRMKHNTRHKEQREGWRIDRAEINSPKICENKKKRVSLRKIEKK